ncbi:MAG: type I-C CRISPR-associated protein Cas5 [Acidobacteria bacterium]|nr:MAG: type I-C CRISPR-associated protein Cas5 [Acidobacteriota bacterium]
MTASRSPTLALRARGPLACFTRPELKAERMSYEVPTPSAARGLLEAVLWKPAIRWHVRRIKVLRPIDFIAFRRNEVATKAARPSMATVKHGGEVPRYFADDDRTQRNTVALRDVDYVIEAYLSLTERAGPDDNMTKFVDMFERRVRKGQHFHQPYFGCRELVAEVLPAGDAPPPIDDSRDLGVMLWDVDYSPKGNRAIFFRARLEHGVLEVPEDPVASFAAAAEGGGS